jgi:amidase
MCPRSQCGAFRKTISTAEPLIRATARSPRADRAAALGPRWQPGSALCARQRYRWFGALPAYCCGIIGLRVGLGRIPSFNHTAKIARGIGAQLMATQGPLTRTVRDARLALAVMAKGARRDTRWVDAPLTGPPPPRPIRVALVPEVPGGDTHPAQVEAVRRAGRYLSAAGYRVEEVLPPHIEEAARLWHAIGSNDVFRLLAPNIEEHGDAAARVSLHEWLALYPPTDSLAALDALARRDLLLWRWLDFFNDYPIIVLPTHCDLPPPWGDDQTREGQQRFLQAVRVGLIAPLLPCRSGCTAHFARGFSRVFLRPP